MMPVKKTNHNNNHNHPMKLLSSPENGFWRMTTSGSRNITRQRLSTFKLPNNARRKRLQIRRLRWATYQTSDHRCLKKDHVDDSEGSNSREEGNEGSTEMSVSLSFSSSCDHSSENYDVLSGFDDEKNTCKDEERLTCVSHGLVSVIGRRREMEDAVRVEVGLAGKGGEKYDFFAVYDGHGGARVAEACKERLHRVLMEMIAEDEKEGSEGGIGWERLMEGSFEKMDEEVNRGRLREDMVGSTAVVAMVGKEELVVANCGDSRAVLFRGGVAVPLSIDHKPDRPDELRRVESAGGRVINWNGYRILGVLATSRSIGDHYLKPFVISKPEVLVSERTDSDEFLILASDGLWDVVSNEVACQVVKRCFSGHIKWASSLEVMNENRATRAAGVLAELALARGSSDNISVIVVELNNPSSNFLL